MQLCRTMQTLNTQLDKLVHSEVLKPSANEITDMFKAYAKEEAEKYAATKYSFDEDNSRKYCMEVARLLRECVDNAEIVPMYKFSTMQMRESVDWRRWYYNAMAPSAAYWNTRERNVGRTNDGNITMYYFSPLRRGSARFIMVMSNCTARVEGRINETEYRSQYVITDQRRLDCTFFAVIPRVQEAACVLLARFVELIRAVNDESEVLKVLQHLIPVAYTIGTTGETTLPVMVEARWMPRTIEDLISMAHANTQSRAASTHEVDAFEKRLLRQFKAVREVHAAYPEDPIMYSTRVWDTEGGTLWLGVFEHNNPDDKEPSRFISYMPSGTVLFLQKTINTH